MIKITGIIKMDVLLKDALVFENSLEQLIVNSKNRKESEEYILSLYREMIIIYGRIFHHSVYKKPLENISEIELNILFYLQNENGDQHIGKLQHMHQDYMMLKLLKTGTSTAGLKDSTVTVHMWRDGDAEYIFSTKVRAVEANRAELLLPQELTRGKEAIHPYLNVFIPCIIGIEDDSESDLIIADEDELKELEAKRASSTVNRNKAEILKINEHEVVIRFDNRIAYKKIYTLDFDIEQFHYRLKAAPVSDRIIEREHIYHYTFRFQEISDNALKVLRNFLAENIH
jgi:hypothetical protein